VGYGDITPVTEGGTWFVVFWLPLNVSFVSIYMGNLARYFMMSSTAYTQRVYKKEVAAKAEYISDPLLALEEQLRHSTISDNHRNEPTIQSMQDAVHLVLENLAYHDDELGAPNVRKQLQLLSPWKKSGVFYSNKARQPSFSLLVLVQERLISILAHEIRILETVVVAKDATFVLTINNLQDTAEKWNIPDGARDAFSHVVFESLVYVGEKRWAIDDAQAFLRLTPLECYKLLSPFLVALEDAGTMEAWLALTEEMATSFCSMSKFSMFLSSRKKTELSGSDDVKLPPTASEKNYSTLLIQQCNNQRDIQMLGKLRRTYNHDLEKKQALYLSKYRANRTVALGTFLLFVLYEVFATIYIMKEADVPVNQAMLFTMYTITSAGFGSVQVPKTTNVLVFLIFNIYISVSGVAVLVRILCIDDWTFKTIGLNSQIFRLPKLLFISHHMLMLDSMPMIRYEWQIVDNWIWPASLKMRSQKRGLCGMR
jgi:hypothetical protein